MSAPPPPPRRFVTAHIDLPAELQSVFSAEAAVSVEWDGPLDQVTELAGIAQHSYAWMLSGLPGNSNGMLNVDPAVEAEENNKRGSRPAIVVRYNDLAPGASVPMHRTTSLDMSVFLIGEAELITPAGAFVPPAQTEVKHTTCRPGDICVQRGTLHGWYNPSKTNWARWVTFAVVAEPVKLKGGQILDKVFWMQWNGFDKQ